MVVEAAFRQGAPQAVQVSVWTPSISIDFQKHERDVVLLLGAIGTATGRGSRIFCRSAPQHSAHIQHNLLSIAEHISTKPLAPLPAASKTPRAAGSPARSPFALSSFSKAFAFFFKLCFQGRDSASENIYFPPGQAEGGVGPGQGVRRWRFCWQTTLWTHLFWQGHLWWYLPRVTHSNKTKPNKQDRKINTLAGHPTRPMKSTAPPQLPGPCSPQVYEAAP